MPRDFDTELVLAAISGSGGVMTTIAERLNVHRATVWRWSKEDEEIAEAITEELESTLDLTESKLLKLIREGDGPSIRFLLTTKGKHRGYTKKIEMDGNLQHGGQVSVYLPDNGRDARGGS